MLVKICGVRTPEIAIAAASAGADFIGFVFFPKSPRFIAPEVAQEIVTAVKRAADELGFAIPAMVGLFVDPGERSLAEAAPFVSHVQLHGHEDAERIAEIRAAFGLSVIKAVGVADKADLAPVGPLAEAADMLLFDARPPKGAERPGGHGERFDAPLLLRYRFETPFLLAGGLDPSNVADAARSLRDAPAFAGVDVSTGVESRPGEKDPAMVKAFMASAKCA